MRCGLFLSLSLVVACSEGGSWHDVRGKARDGVEVIRVPPSGKDTREERPSPDKDPSSGPFASDEKIDESERSPALSWVHYEPDSDFHNMFGGVFWRIKDGFIEIKDAQRPTGSLSLVAQCLGDHGGSFETWSAAHEIKLAHLYATAVTESGCTNQSGSFDGLSSGLMQVTGTTCVTVMGKTGRKLTASGCKTMMYESPDFSVEVASRYMSDPYQLSLNAFPPVEGMRSDLGPALDPPKVAAAYNAGALKETKANRWHLLVTSDHLERYVNAYNAFVEYKKKERAGLLPLTMPTFDLVQNSALPQTVPSPAHLQALESIAREGNSVFVGDSQKKQGDFYYWIAGRWRPASERW